MPATAVWQVPPQPILVEGCREARRTVTRVVRTQYAFGVALVNSHFFALGFNFGSDGGVTIGNVHLV